MQINPKSFLEIQIPGLHLQDSLWGSIGLTIGIYFKNKPKQQQRKNTQMSLTQMIPVAETENVDCSLESFETGIFYLLPSVKELESSSCGITDFDQHCLPRPAQMN